MSVLASGVASALNSVFLITNHLKVNSLVWLGVSCFDAVVVVALVQLTGFGVYAVAGVSRVVGLIVNFIYTPLYASKCLNAAKRTFYPLLVGYVLDSMLLLAMFFLLKGALAPVEGILSFVVNALCLGGVGCIWNYFIFLDKEDRKRMKKIFLRRQEE